MATPTTVRVVAAVISQGGRYLITQRRPAAALPLLWEFPGGRVDSQDSSPEALARCHGLDESGAAALHPGHGDLSPLAFWVTAVRELLEESGVLLACDAEGRAVRASEPGARAAIEAARKTLMAGEAPFPAILARAGWYCDLRPMRYLSHFITPTSSPIRFTARFFLCPIPADQEPALFTEETSEGFWIHPGEGYRRFLAREMAMAEPAEYGLGYLAQFPSIDDLWAAHADGRHKFHGIVDRYESWTAFDWRRNEGDTPRPRA